MNLKNSKVYHNTVKRNINTLEYPIWSPSYSDKLEKEINTNRYKLKGANRLPSSKDIDILNRLLRLVQVRGTNTLHFDSLAELAKELGYSSLNGRDYERVKESLNRWQGTYIEYENSFYVDGEKVSRCDISIIIEKNIKRVNRYRKDIFIKFNESFVKIHEDNFSINIPIKIFEDIKNPYAKRLAEILYKSFREEDEVGNSKPFYMKYETIIEKIPLNYGIRPSRVKKIILEAILDINDILERYSYRSYYSVTEEKKNKNISKTDKMIFERKIRENDD